MRAIPRGRPMTKRAKVFNGFSASVGTTLTLVTAGILFTAAFATSAWSNCCDDAVTVLQPSTVYGSSGGGTAKSGGGGGYTSSIVVSCPKGKTCTNKIASAVRAVRPGGHITVRPGNYVETGPVVIKKPLTIEGTVPPFTDATYYGTHREYFLRNQDHRAASPARYDELATANNKSGRDKRGDKPAAVAAATAAVVKFKDGGRPCVRVDLGKKRNGTVRIRRLKLEHAGGPRIRPCVDVNSPLFVMEHSWVDANGRTNGADPYRGIGDDAVIVRSGLAQIYGNLIEGGKTGVRLTGYYEYQGSPQGHGMIYTRYVCSVVPYVVYEAAYRPPIACSGSASDVAASGYIAGSHLLLDNHIGSNLIGLEVDGRAKVFATRNRIAQNLQSGVTNLDGGGSYTGNHITDNGEGISFVLTTTGEHSTPIWGDPNDPYTAASLRSISKWPLNMPIITGNFINSNNGAGIQVVSALDWRAIDRSGSFGFDDDERYQVYVEMINKIGTVWGNCIMDNTGRSFEILGTKHRDPNGALSGGGRGPFGHEGWPRDAHHEELPRNFRYDNKGEPWLQRKVQKLTKKKYCDWNDAGRRNADSGRGFVTNF